MFNRIEGGVNNNTTKQPLPAANRSVPHPRTLRKAREQVKQMVIDGISFRRIRRYLHQWAVWWVKTTENWYYSELLLWFLQVCWDPTVADYAAGLLYQSIKKSHTLNLAPRQVFQQEGFLVAS